MLSVILPYGSNTCIQQFCGTFFLDKYRARDDLWHISLATTAFRSFPFQIPIFADQTLQGYHFLFALILNFSLSLFSDPFQAYYKIFPIAWYTLYILLSLLAAKKLLPSRAHSFAFLFFQLFGGSLSFVFSIWHHGNFWSTSGYFVNQPGEYFYNPPLAWSLLIFLLSITLFINKRGFLPVLWNSIFQFVMWGLKFYGGCVFFVFWIAYYTQQYFQRKRTIKSVFGIAVLFLLITFFALMVFYGLGRSTVNGSIFILRPFAIMQAFIEEPSLFYIHKVAVARYFAYAHHMPYIYLPIELFTLTVYLFFTFGTRVVGFIPAIRCIVCRRYESLNLAVYGGIVFAITMTIFFVQRGKEWFNTVQFMAYALFLSNFLVAKYVGDLLALKGRKVYLAIGLIAVLSVHNTINAAMKSVYWQSELSKQIGFTPQNPLVYISLREEEALHFLSKQPSGTVYTLRLKPVDTTPAQANIPQDLQKVNDTAYISAYTGKPVYFANAEQLSILGVDYKAREQLIAATPNLRFGKLPIRYLYLLKWHQLYPATKSSATSQKLKSVFENAEVEIFRLY